MTAYILAIISIPITATILSCISLLLTKIESVFLERQLRISKKGIGFALKRIWLISMFVGAVDTTITKTGAFFVARNVFGYFSQQMTVTFVILYATVFIVMDLARIKKFKNNEGIWTEIGYLFGDIIGSVISIIAFTS
ncbi:MAG: hypothetical protein WCT18_04710 [Patescibacteria group bacterium]